MIHHRLKLADSRFIVLIKLHGCYHKMLFLIDDRKFCPFAVQ